MSDLVFSALSPDRPGAVHRMFQALQRLLAGLLLDADRIYQFSLRLNALFVSDLVTTFIANKFTVEQSVAMNASQSVQALEGVARCAHPSGSIAVAFGTIGHVIVSGAGTVTEARGMQASTGLSGAGTLSLGIGVHVPDSFNLGGGTLTTLVGIKIAKQTVGATNIAIDAVEAFQADYSATADHLRLLIWDVSAGAFKRVKRGAAGTGPGGTGRALYIDS